MAVQVEVRQLAHDGKLRLLRPRSEADQQAILQVVHAARCRDRRSFRAVQDSVARAGYRVSLGRVHQLVASTRCQYCADGPVAVPVRRVPNASGRGTHLTVEPPQHATVRPWG